MSELIVAVDGSQASLAAVDWAAAEATSLDWSLRLVHVIAWPHVGMAAEDAESLSAELLVEAVARVRHVAPVARVRTQSLQGPVGPTLLRTAQAIGDEPTGTLVLGQRSVDSFASMALGSLAAEVATHAQGPVIVVPATLQRSWRTTRSEVVVGVDGTDGSARAVAYSFWQVAQHARAIVERNQYAFPQVQSRLRFTKALQSRL